MAVAKAQFNIPGGVHPAYCKDLARDQAIQDLPLPATLAVSMAQHLGRPADPTVKKGDTVLRGQIIGTATGFISAAVHAPTSGTVKSITDEPTASGTRAPVIEIEPDGHDTEADAMPALLEWTAQDREVLVARVADAGIAGMGGAGFPTHVKLSPPPDKPIDTLILNGAECEPYLTADYRLMVECGDDIWQGAQVIQHILGARQLYVAIEDNKPEALDAMQNAMPADLEAEVVALPTEYPHGAEKQQIFSITGREVPSGGLPMDVGCVVENVGTALAVCDAVIKGRPLTERVTTVTGRLVAQPGNLRARLGTRYDVLVQACGGTTGDIAKVISGGPMMGLAQPDLHCGTTKTTSGLLLLSPDEAPQFDSVPCISCGRCVSACPMKLMPSELSQFLEAEDYESADDYGVMDCIECGCCAFECPAHRPLVQHMRSGKAYVAAARRAKQ